LLRHNSYSMRGRWFAASLVAGAGLALATVVSPSVGAEPAKPYDRCAYMNRDSKAYKACLSEQAAAKQKAEAPPAPAPKPKPNPRPNS
jgi:hypothetical protein